MTLIVKMKSLSLRFLQEIEGNEVVSPASDVGRTRSSSSGCGRSRSPLPRLRIAWVSQDLVSQNDLPDLVAKPIDDRLATYFQPGGPSGHERDPWAHSGQQRLGAERS